MLVEEDLLDARKELEVVGQGRAIGDAFSIFTDGGAGLFRLARNGQAIKNDVEALIDMNKCGSRELRRFQEKLRLYALGKPALACH